MEWPLDKKLLAVLERVPGRLPGRARDEFLGLLTLESLALSLAIIAGFCLLSGGTGLVLGFAVLGIDVSMSLATALQLAALAGTPRELDEAADELAHVVLAVGVAALIHGVGRIAKGARGGSPPRETPQATSRSSAIETPPPSKTASPEPVGESLSPRGVAPTQEATVGSNTVIWTKDAGGRTVRAEGTIRRTFSKLKRSSEEVAAQRNAAAAGKEGDVGGHLVGHRFVGDQGEINLFPQDMQFNNSAFKTMENEIADWTKAGKEVNFSYELEPPGATRPDAVRVRYRVVDPATGEQVYFQNQVFENDAGQVFDRVPRSAMEGLSE
jgi:hypothetical protein